MTELPGWLSLLPPLTAIVLAVLLRQVVLALFAGVWLGAFFTNGFNPLLAFLRSLDSFVLPALADADHAAIILFTLLLGGMVGVINRSGGARGLAELVTRAAANRRRGQLAGWLMGLVIFFDDYANTLLVGPTMRPITDRLKISREKLAYIVDSTAAPVACIALFSSWIGMEVGLIADQIKLLGLNQDAYLLFLRSIPHMFYPLLTLLFVFLVGVLGRDFGPMLRAERRALVEGKPLRDGAQPAASLQDPELQPAEDARPRSFLAIAPILTVALGMLAGLVWEGLRKAKEAGLELTPNNILAGADAIRALLWASFAGCLMAVLLSWSRRVLTLSQALSAWLAGMRSLMLAVVILLLAWSLGAVCKELKTADFVVSLLGGWLPLGLLPAATFSVAAAVSFATGTSWGTMAILFPLVMPLAHHLAPGDETLMLGAVSSILAGSIFGDHCSPISDTTVMSSMASACDHVDHVRTQLPYALLVAAISILFGDLACGLGLYGAGLGLALAAVALFAVLRLWGRRAED